MIKKKSNMYDWVDDTRNFLGGECKHFCCYCYVNTMKDKFPNLKEKYSGKPRLIQKEFERDLGSNKTIFVQNMNDLFADDVPDEFIKIIIEHCKKFPTNIYVFQSKNPQKMFKFVEILPENSWIGTTCESNVDYPDISKAVSPLSRLCWLQNFKLYSEHNNTHFKTFITIEPILTFDVEEFAEMIIDAKPDFINIGCDSKNSKGLPEPNKEDIEKLIEILKEKTTIKIKENLKRIMGMI